MINKPVHLTLRQKMTQHHGIHHFNFFFSLCFLEERSHRGVMVT